MERRLSTYTVIIDGIDKCGKDLVAKYVWRMDKALNVFCRGYISLEVYNRKFKRSVEYNKPLENCLYVLLEVDEHDWKIRCDINNEPKINYEEDNKLFEEVYEELNVKNKMKINTTYTTAYNAAKQIINAIQYINGGTV